MFLSIDKLYLALYICHRIYNFCHRSIMIVGKTTNDIFESIRSMVHSGEFKSGDLLPPLRELAQHLDVNRNTVAAAYKKLVDAGIAVSEGRKGTSIREKTHTLTREGTPPGLALLDLSGGNPSSLLLPNLQLAFQHIAYTPRLYGAASLSEDIEKFARNWMNNDIQVPFELNVTNGAVDAIERVLSSYLIAGDKVAVEDPCFLGSINTLHTNRYTAVGIPIDEHGLCIDTLSQQLKNGIQALIITPRAHNPTGYGLSKTRADQVRQLLSLYPHVLIIIDDHFSLLSTHNYHHIVPLESKHWALIRSLSKCFGPDIRLAIVASDHETSSKLQQRLNSGTNWVSHILQDLAVYLLQSEAISESLEQAKNIYKQRREKLIHALQAKGLRVSNQHDGLNVWVQLNNESTPVIMALAKQGWLVRAGEIFGLKQASYGLRITVSELNDEVIDSLAATLSQSIE
ncbi:transcriptional regulator PtsJ [Vibrio anguillarum]|nr:transcriptional regulator PtsJ [Vibrio anguillarum]MBT2919787.1 transcriptional regulator PtsJ [Vibrio anguillarum]